MQRPLVTTIISQQTRNKSAHNPHFATFVKKIKKLIKCILTPITGYIIVMTYPTAGQKKERMKMQMYKGHHIERLYNGFYEVYVNGRFWKADTLRGIKNIINENK
jgi:hypothetical protein